MPAKGHALLSASSSERWLRCPPSARLCESYDDKGSNYAAEGTDAHELCEYKLRKALGMEAQDPTENLTWFNEEMSDCANGYAAYVLEQVEAAKQTCADPVVLIEQRVDFSRWVESGYGTADCIIIADGTLQIIDYKHGLGVLVSAEENPQMQCYALGALELFDDIYDIDSVRMTIYQPRREPSLIQVDSERAQYWLGVGALPTEAVEQLLKITGDWQKFKGIEGAEGTLKTAEPKPSKLDLFNKALEDAQGTEAARLYLEQMTAHHEGAVDMARDEVTDGQNPQAIALAEQVIEDQEAETAEMEQMLNEL